MNNKQLAFEETQQAVGETEGRRSNARSKLMVHTIESKIYFNQKSVQLPKTKRSTFSQSGSHIFNTHNFLFIMNFNVMYTCCWGSEYYYYSVSLSIIICVYTSAMQSERINE